MDKSALTQAINRTLAKRADDSTLPRHDDSPEAMEHQRRTWRESGASHRRP